MFFWLAVEGEGDESILSLIDLLVANPRNEEAWTKFHKRYDLPISRMVNARMKRYGRQYNDVEAGDFVQKVYERLLQNSGRALRSFHGAGEREFLCYLAQICLNIIKDQRRRQPDTVSLNHSLRSAVEDPKAARDHNPSMEPDQERAVQRRELRDMIVNSLQEVGDGEGARRNRLIFFLRQYRGLSLQEIADLLQLPKTRVVSSFYRTRKKIATDIAKALEKDPNIFYKLL